MDQGGATQKMRRATFETELYSFLIVLSHLVETLNLSPAR